uniref:Uncharacterized protein n=1 Tax=uncultured prokaryote TaxID=198431 RepID=A0A0H5Q7G4_9ZZZZ|nr:hypothetical protein [uncultured prokaryote]
MKNRFQGVGVRKNSLGECSAHEDHIVVYLTTQDLSAARFDEVVICPRDFAHAEIMNVLHDSVSEKLRSAWSNLPPDPLF